MESEPCWPQYQAHQLTSEDMRMKSDQKMIQLTIGEESCQTNSSYCNGFLKSGTTYLINFRLFNRQRFSDTDYITIDTKSNIPFLMTLMSSLSVMFAVLIAGFIITNRRSKALQYVHMKSLVKFHKKKFFSHSKFPFLS